MSEGRYRFGAFTFDGHVLVRDDLEIDISAQQARVLTLLLARAGRLVTRSELNSEVCRTGSSESLDKAVSRLRAVLSADDAGSGYIKTRRNDGYWFAAPCKRLPSEESVIEYRGAVMRWNRREPESTLRAITDFDRLLEREPRYADAYAAQANCYAILGSYWARPHEAARKAEAFAHDALRFDKQLAEPLVTLGFLRSLYKHEWEPAEQQLREAVARDPSSPTAHHWYALCLSAMNKPMEALEEITVAQGLDCQARIIDVHAAAILYWARRYDLARRQCEKVLRYYPGFWYGPHQMALLDEVEGRLDEALAGHRQALSSDPTSPRLSAALARVHALRGERTEARRVIRQLCAQRTARAGYFHIATAYAALGDGDKACEYLTSACRSGDVWVSFAALDPRLDGLRASRRFAQIGGELGLSLPGRPPRPHLPRQRLARVVQQLDL